MQKHDTAKMAKEDAVRAEIKKVIDEANEDFADIEQIKDFAILESDLSEQDGELTPTMKVKRQKVHENHRDVFEGLYEEGEGSPVEEEDDDEDENDGDAGDGGGSGSADNGNESDGGDDENDGGSDEGDDSDK